MILIFSLMLITQSSTISSSYILNDSIDQDEFSLDIYVTSDTSITNLKIIFFDCIFSSNAQVALQTSSIQYQNVYIFTIDISQKTIKIEQHVNDFSLLAYQLNLRIGQFIYPTINTIFQYQLLLNLNSANSETKSLNRAARQLMFLSTTVLSLETSNQNTLQIEYQPNFKNYDYNVISLEFVSQQTFPLQFLQCKGIQNYAQDTICWSKDNFLYIQQQSSTFQSNENKGKIIIDVINFINPYYLGTFNINVLLKHINQLQNDYYSSFASSSIIINQQRDSPLIISHSNLQINQTSSVTLNFNVKIFNQFLLVDLTIPNQQQQDYLILCDDTNIIIKDVKYQNYNNQILILQALKSLGDFNITLKINNFQNFEIPVSQSFQYTLKEVFDQDTNQLKMQHGKGKISFISNDVTIKNIDCSSYYLNDNINVTITLEADIVINKFAIIQLQFNNQLRLNNLKIQSNQILADNSLKIYNVFDGQSKQQKIQIFNIQNPLTPSNFNFLDLQIYYKNYLIASNINQVAVDIISGKSDVIQATLYNLINNSFTTLIISIEFNIIHPYISNLVFLFDTSNINFDQLTKELQCSLDEVIYQCQIFMDKLTIFQISLTKQKYEIKIQYFPYPRSIQPLIIKQIQQINSTIILTQSQNSFSINTDYYRRFEDFKVSSSQITSLLKTLALSLIIIPSQQILQNEYLTLQFNGYLETSYNTECQININTVQIQCEFYSDSIKILIINGQLNHNYNYNLILSNVRILKNFISLNLIAFTQNEYIQQQSTCYFKIDQTEQSSQFPQFSFDPKDLVLYQTSEYFLFFENSKAIPQNGFLELQMKDLNIDFLQGEVVGVSGYEAISNTQIYRTKNTFGLRFYYQNEVQSGVHLIQLANITNPSFNKMLDSYTFYLYSYDSQNNMLEQQEYDLMINFTCPISNCSICNQPNFCDKCESNQITYYGQCIDSCPIGTVLINDSCQKCNTPSSCLQCSEYDTVLCKQCSDGYSLINGFCKWIIDTVNDSQTNQTLSNNTHYQNNSNTYEQQKNEKQLSQKQKIYDVNIFAIIVLSISILFISRSIFRKQTDFNNALIAISGIADISLQFMLFIIILINYNFGQSILALTLIFISIIQQGFAFSTLKFHTSLDVNYFINLAQNKVTRLFRFASLCLDWKVIFIHKSCLTDSPVFNIKFKDEIRFGRIFKFLFSIKICVNILNILMLGIIILSQFQIAQLIYESICYNFALIFIQLNKIYEINQYLKNKTTKNYLERQVSDDQNHNQEEKKPKTAKVTPECIIIKNSDQI